jgi:hypothetical protein
LCSTAGMEIQNSSSSARLLKLTSSCTGRLHREGWRGGEGFAWLRAVAEGGGMHA